MRHFLLAVCVVVSLCFGSAVPAFAAQVDIPAPPGSSTSYGTSVTALPNGNLVVLDPSYSIPSGAANVGAVYLINGTTNAIISTLTGSTANDQVGGRDVVVLGSSSNFVVSSSNWNGTMGAATWVNGTTGLSGTVSASNSLVGTTAGDQVGIGGVYVLTNGNYVVSSLYWNANRGAATWGNGTTGISGAVSSSNSLVGSTAGTTVGSTITGDLVGSRNVFLLTNGNYVVASPRWNGNMGAATWGDGTMGISGFISSTNSLVGSTAGNTFTGDSVSGGGVYPLTNGNYVVSSFFWSGQKGAVTFGNGATGISGTISASNSLVGSTGGDTVGSAGVVALKGSNGNYVVVSPAWNQRIGAATWGNGTTGTSGTISSSNSLVGSAANDAVASTVTALTNGNYVVASASWNGKMGAATWGNGTTGISGTISSSNSLVGSAANDSVASTVTALTNGNYVVASASWNGKMGAVTWGNGTTGISGAVSSSNSLVGSTADSSSTSGDQVGNRVYTLTNGNYVVASYLWNARMGAATWGSGTTGISGAVSSSNSLVGSTALVGGSTTGDQVGSFVRTLTNGNYVVASYLWNGSMGAATWGNGTTGISGTISSSNSLVGSTALVGGSTTGDQVGNDVLSLTNGNYFVASPAWNANMGAATWGNGTKGISGTISSSNSLVGTMAGDQVAYNEPTALTNGDYVVGSAKWTNGSVTNAGAITYLSGTSGTPTGMITAANSVLGAIANDVNYGYDYVPQSQRLYVGRQQSKTLSYLTIYFVPTVTSVAPASGTALGGTSVTITGTNFIGATGVTIGGSLATNVVVVNTTTITCTTPSGTAGTASVVVTTPAGSNPANTLFTYNNPVPTLTNTSPTSVTAGASDTTITLTGTNFVTTSTVNVNGKLIATTFVSATSLTAMIPTANLATAGTLSITVVNAAAGRRHFGGANVHRDRTEPRSDADVHQPCQRRNGQRGRHYYANRGELRRHFNGES